MNQTILTAKQSQLLESLIVEHGEIVTSSQIITLAKENWDYQQAKNLITKLVKNGWLIRIKRGLYAISSFSSRGFLSLSQYVIANLLVPDSYVSFESALAHYGMFDQLTAKTVSISLSRFKPVTLNATEYQFINIQSKLFFGWQEIMIDDHTTHIAYPEKSLIDIINFHKNKYSIDLVIEKLTKYQDQLDLPRLEKYLAKLPTTTIKIFGFIYDLIGINSENLHKMVASKNSTHWMIPGDSKFNSKWRLYYDSYFDKYL